MCSYPLLFRLRSAVAVSTMLLPLLLGTTWLFPCDRSFLVQAQYGGLGFGVGLNQPGGGIFGGGGGFGGLAGSPFGNYGNFYGAGFGGGARYPGGGRQFYPQYPYYGGYPCYYCGGGGYPSYGGYPYYGNGLSTAYASSSGGVASAQASSGSNLGGIFG